MERNKDKGPEMNHKRASSCLFRGAQNEEAQPIKLARLYWPAGYFVLSSNLIKDQLIKGQWLWRNVIKSDIVSNYGSAGTSRMGKDLEWGSRRRRQKQESQRRESQKRTH